LDRRKFELQIRAILVTFRIEHRARNSTTMERFRERAHHLLDELDRAAAPHPDLREKVTDARSVIDGDDL
jgi:hypothetical protein